MSPLAARSLGSLALLGFVLGCAGIGGPLPMSELGAKKVCACTTTECVADAMGTYQTMLKLNADAIAAMTPPERAILQQSDTKLQQCSARVAADEACACTHARCSTAVVLTYMEFRPLGADVPGLTEAELEVLQEDEARMKVCAARLKSDAMR